MVIEEIELIEHGNLILLPRGSGKQPQTGPKMSLAFPLHMKPRH
jgi:hypothetical protein